MAVQSKACLGTFCHWDCCGS